MIALFPYLANSIWQARSRRAWGQFKRYAQQVKTAQVHHLQHILWANQRSQWGQQNNFETIHSPADFQNQVPLTTYDDYIPWVERAAGGKPHVLTWEKINLFELSSGSTAASKLIPYTASLQEEFNQGIGTWIYNLFEHYPALKGGTAYWSISPLGNQKQYTSGGIPIGFEEDSAYLGKIGGVLENAVMAVPKSLKRIENIENFRYLTLMHLLRQQNLKIISIWNPTFLTQLLAPLPDWWERLLNDIRQGSLNPPHPIPRELHIKLNWDLHPHPQRANRLRCFSPSNYAAIWPELQLISCWMSGPAKSYAQNLQKQFPKAQFQPKGLIATEAFISFPIVGYAGSALAINSHFFEFILTDSRAERPFLADQLEVDKQYEVLVTTGGGLYRYQMHDIVKVVGFFHEVPLIDFVSKSNHISDFFGEKLNEAFVKGICQRLFQGNHLEPVFYLLAPQDPPDDFHYTLYLESERPFDTKVLVSQLEKMLCENFHYAYARKLEQLAPVRIKRTPAGSEGKYLQHVQSQGTRLGDIKPMRLSNKTGWEKIFYTG